MRDLVVIAVVVIILAAIAAAIKGAAGAKKKNGGTADGGPPVLRKKPLLSEAERTFLETLVAAIPDGYQICVKVGLKDLVELDWRARNAKTWFNRINQKHTDFVICEGGSLLPAGVIELDDKSHQGARQAKRDAEKDAVLAAAGIPLRRVPVRGRGYAVAELRDQVTALLGTGAAAPAAGQRR
jgi:hypothetical protein